MHLIKECPSCSRKLRFPIEKGKIRVTCACGQSFIADPDDPDLFANASFDLKGPGHTKAPLSAWLKAPFATVPAPGEIKKTLIAALYSFKYRIQNFSLLPSREKIRLIALLSALIALAILIVVYACRDRQAVPVDGMII
jgi:hypothetical protein